MKKLVIIISSILIIFILLFLCMDVCYVKLIDCIGEQDNKKLEMLLKIPFPSLDKVSGHFPLRLLVETEENNSPLEQACQCGNYEAAKMLISKGADASIIQKGHFSLLFLTMESTEPDDYKLIKLLVENGANPRGAINNDYENESALEKCAEMDCSDYYYNSYLAKYKEIKHDQDEYYYAKYDLQKAEMIVDIYKYLESRTKKSINPQEEQFGITPLHQAVNRQNIALTKYLLKEGIYGLNDQDQWGVTCLCSLVKYEESKEYDKTWKKEIVELIIQNGADPTIKDKEGKTPYDYAVEHNDDYLAGLLKPYMKKSDKDSEVKD